MSSSRQPTRPPVEAGRQARGSDVAPLDGLLAGLRLALFGRNASAQAAATLASVENWPAVAELAHCHHVSGLLLQGLRTQPRLLAASDVEPELQAWRKRDVRNCARQFNVLRQALDCFAEQGVRCLVLKGLPLAARLYGDPFARRSVDVDLLVDGGSFAACRRMLLTRGFRLKEEFPETPARRRWDAKTNKTQTFLAGGVAVELHWRLLANPGYMDTAFGPLYERRSSAAIGTVQLPTLGAVDEFLYLICHGAGHSWLRLKWLCDVALLCDAMPEDQFARVAERCRAARIEAVLESTLGACREAFGVQGPAAGRRNGASRRAAAVVRSLPPVWRVGRMPPFWRKVPLRLALKPDMRFAWHEFLRTLTKPEDWRRVALPDALFFLYFPLRPVLLLADGLAMAWSRWPFPWARVAGWPRALEAALLLCIARLLVKRVPLRYWRAWLTTADVASGAEDGAAQARLVRAHTVARTVRSVARRTPFKAVCLPQAIAAQWMLRRRGATSRLWFGVRRPAGAGDDNAGRLEYHAWLTVGGQCVLGGGEIPSYATMPPIDAAPGRSARQGEVGE